MTSIMRTSNCWNRDEFLALYSLCPKSLFEPELRFTLPTDVEYHKNDEMRRRERR